MVAMETEWPREVQTQISELCQSLHHKRFPLLHHVQYKTCKTLHLKGYHVLSLMSIQTCMNVL